MIPRGTERVRVNGEGQEGTERVRPLPAGIDPFPPAMPATEMRRSLEDLARLGAEAFVRRVRPMPRPEGDGKFVAIDVGTGDFELDDDDDTAVARLRSRRPGTETWLGRVGAPATDRMGRRS
jgi:hypothetical protein